MLSSKHKSNPDGKKSAEPETCDAFDLECYSILSLSWYLSLDWVTFLAMSPDPLLQTLQTENSLLMKYVMKYNTLLPVSQVNDSSANSNNKAYN